MIAALTNHLWQSTLFVIAAAIVASALRKNGADIRHRVWLIASLKFLVPLSLLMSVGSLLPAVRPAVAPTPASSVSDLSVTVDRIVQPFSNDEFVASTPATTATSTNWMAIIIVNTWACGFLAVAFMRFRGWRRIRAAVRASTPAEFANVNVKVRATSGLLEPGVVGLWRPVLLVPAGIDRQLTPRQLDAVLAHELCHVQRWDNLTSAIHMVVEAVFWFHPLVWVVGARLVDERERACDEYVLRVCGAPRVYAESILSVCKLYVESPIACVSGVSGADLKRRIAAIMVNRIGVQLSMTRRVTLAIAAMLAIALPLVAGMLTAPLHASALPAPQSGATNKKFDVASVKPCDPDTPNVGGRSGTAGQTSPDYLYLPCRTLRTLVDLAYDGSGLLNKPYGPGGVPDAPPVIRGGPSWVNSDRFTIEAKSNGVVALTTATGQWAINDPNTRAMLQALLEDRFQLKVHRATEQQSMYALTVAKTGLKIKPTAPSECWEYTPGKPNPPHDPNVGPCDSWGGDGWGSHEATGLTIGNLTPHFGRSFVDELFFITRRMVIDKTGLEGRYSFKLDFTPDDLTPGLNGRGGRVPEERPTSFRSSDTIFKALERLGLKLEPIKAPAEYIVIDRAERLRPDFAAGAATSGKPASDPPARAGASR